MLIYKGAEADINKKHYLGFTVIEKKRKKKRYRAKEIDEKIRKQRTKQEASMIIKARKAVKTPYLFNINLKKTSIIMEYIDGIKLKNAFEKGKELNKMKSIAQGISKMHSLDIIHGDLTTSNIILKGKNLYFIDFGLSYISNKIEDKAVDLLNFKKMMKATHYKHFDKLWNSFEKSYKNKQVLKKIKEIEARARYT